MKHPWILVVALGMAMAVRAEEELFTNVYVVPPTFLSVEAGSPRPPAKELLEKVGISFPKGASAIYNATTSQLIVRNTEKQMELVEAYIESIRSMVEIQIYLTVREAGFRGELSDLLKSGGSNSNTKGKEVDGKLSGLLDFPDVPRSGQRGVKSYVFESYESFQTELANPPGPLEGGTAERMIRESGSLTDPQFQVILRRLAQVKGIQFLSLPSVMARSGQPAVMRSEKRRYGIVAAIGADENTIDLDLFLPEHGKALKSRGENGLEPTIRTIVPDGGTVVVAEKNANGESRLVFIHAQLLDPAGMPIRKAPQEPGASLQEEPVELPTKPDPSSLSPEEEKAVKKADQIADEASDLLADGKFGDAVEQFEKALNFLPKHEFSKQRRMAYEKQLSRAKEGMAKKTSSSGFYVVSDGETLAQIAARAGNDAEDLQKMNRLGDAPLKKGQILLIPGDRKVESRTANLLKELVLPEIDFNEVSLVHALAMLQEEILRLHDSDLFPEATPVFVLEVPENTREATLTLRLSNVPAHEALRYIVSLASCRYEVDGREVRILWKQE